MKYEKLKRICKRCNKKFTPTGRYDLICDKCTKPRGYGKTNWGKKK